jgi:hypothetical protein
MFWSAVIGVALGNGAATLLMFAVKLVTVPTLLYTEQESRICELTMARNRRQLAARLARQSERVVHEFWANKPNGNNADEVSAWRNGIDRWHAETLRIMEQEGCTEPEIGSVRTVGNLTQFERPGGGIYHPIGRINQGLLMIEGYRRRLQAVIDKHE